MLTCHNSKQVGSISCSQKQNFKNKIAKTNSALINYLKATDSQIVKTEICESVAIYILPERARVSE
jgi:hypothetical protein